MWKFRYAGAANFPGTGGQGQLCQEQISVNNRSQQSLISFVRHPFSQLLDKWLILADNGATESGS